jgi:hypothetical protein
VTDGKNLYVFFTDYGLMSFNLTARSVAPRWALLTTF